MSRVDWHGDEFLRGVLVPAVHDGLTSLAITLQGAMTRNLNSTASPSSPGGFPGNLTGELGRSITYTTPANLSVKVGSTLPYAVTLERGATIVARGKKLTVPLNDRAVRMRRQNASLVGASPKLSFIRTPSGAYLVRNVGGKAARTEFWFKLMDRITVAPRPWAMRTVRESKEALLKAFAAGTRRSLTARLGATA